jgi:hypothetical protein
MRKFNCPPFRWKQGILRDLRRFRTPPYRNLRPAVLIVLLLLLPGEPAHGSPLVLARNGQTRFRISLTHDASPIDRKAAQELQRYLREVARVDVRIVQSDTSDHRPLIWIGSAGHAEGFPPGISWDSLREDGFTIKTRDDQLIIAGGTDKGTLYGVYTFLETYLGCRLYSPTVRVIPGRSEIVLPAVDDTQVPALTFRDAFTYDPEFMAWHKLDNHDDLFGLYVHTFRHFLPPEKHFASHPEFYTLSRAGRVPNYQLCLTNPGVFSAIVESLRSEMRRKPEKPYWSVSQNDTFGPCGCEACRAIDIAEGTNSGSLLAFVNRVADRFPEKTISTLAYQYTRSAPATIRPRPNVNIMLCSIECNRSRPISADTTSASFRRDIEAWTRLTGNIYLWDYVVQFRNLMSPFPNLRVLQPNIQYFVKHGITALFEQGSGRLPNEFKELRTYLIAKLLWNPDRNVDTLINDFFRGYYGAAAPYLREYIDTMHDALEASGEELLIYGFPLPSERGYLSPRAMDTYVALFDSAEESVQENPDLLERVQIARLPLQFALIEQAKVYGTGKRGCFAPDGSGTWRGRREITALVDTFAERCKAFGITALNESGLTPGEYAGATRVFLKEGMRTHLALFRPVQGTIPASPKYRGGDVSALTDGLKGLDDYHMNWVGWEGEEMLVTVDLGSPMSVRRIQADFLQDGNSWIFLPRQVEYALSHDGETFRSVATPSNTIPAERPGIFRTPFAAEIEPTTARFVRVKTASLKTCPEWHNGAGGPSWIFADEIIVE